MATVTANAMVSRRHRSVTIAPALAVAAMASIGAGVIHAAAIGVHSEHKQAVIAFTVVAAVQLAWGIGALLTSNRWVVLAGAAANTAAFAGWVMAKTSGISFVDGLDVAEGVQFADFAAAMLAAVAVIGAIAAVLQKGRPTSLGQQSLVISAVVVTLITVPAMVSAGSHNHAHGAAGHDHGSSAAGHSHGTGGAGGAGGAGGGHTHSVALPAKEYDPTKPIDLSGVDGVTPEQQARAENLIAITLLRLPQWADYHTAEAAGFVSIGDGVTGHEHFINVDYFTDGRILDPDHPESLVYEPQQDGSKKLVSAMFMLDPSKTLNDVPDIGGKLTQWHIHNNLCFTATGQVAGLTGVDGTCRPGLNKGNEAPMIHVWITKHPCGPFAALEGVGAGQIKDGETRLCDAAHGGH
jgi:hypothetical protein